MGGGLGSSVEAFVEASFAGFLLFITQYTDSASFWESQNLAETLSFGLAVAGDSLKSLMEAFCVL